MTPYRFKSGRPHHEKSICGCKCFFQWNLFRRNEWNIFDVKYCFANVKYACGVWRNEFYFTLRQRSNISRLPQGKHFTSLVGGIFYRSYIYKNASKRFLDIVEAISSIFAHDCKGLFQWNSFLWNEWNIFDVKYLLRKCEIRLRRVKKRSWKTIIRFAKNIEC